MTRRRRYLFWGGSIFTLVTVLVMLVPLVTQGASQFADPAFQTQWNSVEGTLPNFWGPLGTAREGQAEPYVEGTYMGQTGRRLVQYFDKARMELTNPSTSVVTNGLLTVELKTGALQLGDNTFQQYPGASIGIAGDPGQPGPTYASLGSLPESNPQASGAVSLVYNVSTNTFTNGTPSTDPNAAFSSYLADSSGRYGQNIPKAFTDFLAKIPGGALPAMGYPISAPFMASITVNGTANVPVIIQAFQRKVLTYTPSNMPAFQVEFGNIGQHYYQWRYVTLTGAGATASATVCTTATFTPTSTGTPTATPTGIATPTATTTPICVPYAAPTVCATATSTPGTGVITNTPTATVGIGTPFPTDPAFGNVCATSTPYGTNTPTTTATATITSTPDATGTAIAGTATDQASTAYAQTSTADAQTSTAYAQTSTAFAAATSTLAPGDMTSTAQVATGAAQSTAGAALATAQANATGTATNAPVNSTMSAVRTQAAMQTATQIAAQTNVAALSTSIALTGTPPISIPPTHLSGPDYKGQTATAAAKTSAAGTAGPSATQAAMTAQAQAQTAVAQTATQAAVQKTAAAQSTAAAVNAQIAAAQTSTAVAMQTSVAQTATAADTGITPQPPGHKPGVIIPQR